MSWLVVNQNSYEYCLLGKLFAVNDVDRQECKEALGTLLRGFGLS